MDQTYTLTVIEDMETPLAAGAPQSTPFFAATLAIIVLVVIFLAVTLYLIECAKFRKRYIALYKEESEMLKPSEIGWNISRLKELVMEAEADEAGKILEETFV